MEDARNKEQFSHGHLKRFAVAALEASGLAADKADCVAETMLQADLMGHTTHGIGLLPLYVEELNSGGMSREGDPQVLTDFGSAVAWDGNYLPGHWLTHQAIDLALERLATRPVVTVTIRRSHHTGSLASYPERATASGKVMILMCSDPNSELVAPFGGRRGVYSANPIAAGFPTSGRPVIFDTSTSTAAVGVAMRAKRLGLKLPGRWMQDSEGNATDDPNVLDTDPPGAILPMGGEDHGYKGFALGLMVEAMTAALGGHGRADEPGRWGCSTFLQLIDPEAFGGLEAFRREMDFLGERCRQSPPISESSPVRLPGDRAIELRERQLREGIRLGEGIAASLRELGKRMGLEF